jgi:uncharacterized membrane protein YozB (DUF420 family)
LAKRRNSKSKGGDLIGLAVVIIVLIGLTGSTAKLKEVLGSVTAILTPVAVIVMVAVAVLLIARWRRYKKSDYYEQKQNATAWIKPACRQGCAG